jgi:maltose O-acetyltransferase
MLAGEMYLAADPELVDGRHRARRLTARYGATDPEALDERRALLTELLGSVGKDVWIEAPFFCDYGSNIVLGDGVFLNFNCVVLDCAAVRIGPSTLIGPAVQLSTATHPADPRERESGLEFARPITIGQNVWIGSAAIVGPGVTIGDDSVIGAGAVVIRDVPAGVLAAGNPCRVIREL